MKTNNIKAYCGRDGHIKFGNRVPKGSLLIMEGPAKKLREKVSAVARWSYPDKHGKEHPIVPGIPEAPDDHQALAALWKFSVAISNRMAQ